MEITFKGAQYDLPARITEWAGTKLQGLKKYLGRDADVAHAYVELGKEVGSHQSGTIWSASIRLAVKGKSYTAKAIEESIENAVDRVVDEMSSELKKAKQKERGLFRKGGQALKDMMRGGITA